ncbi:MAG: MFS transporter [Ilumatobacteraceae bacterium]
MSPRHPPASTHPEGPMADTLSEIPLHERPEIHARRWFLLGVMYLSLVMVVMAVSGLNVAIPSLQRDLDASATDLQWIVDSYAIVFAGLLLSAGAIGDRFGRKRALMAGLAVFAVGSFIGALADSSTQVIASRAIAGIGAAFVMPATLSLLTAVFPPHERGKAIAVWAGFAGAGGALGPLLVGFLLTGWWIFPSFWWGAAFVVNAVTPLIVLTVVAIYAPRSKDDEATPLDPVGAVLSLIGIAALLFGIIEGPERGWGDAYVVGGFVLGIGLLAGFVLWERHAEHPMLPMQYFRARPFSTGTGIITFGFLVMFGFFFLITQYFQFVKGYTPLRRRGDPAVRLHDDHHVAAQRAARPAIRTQSGRRRRPHVDGHRLRPARTDPSGHALPRDRVRFRAARRWDGDHVGAGDRRDHVVGAAQQGRGRLGGQRHDP